MTRRLSIVALLASALMACQLGGETTLSSPSDACLPVGAACASDAACCSYGCAGNVCVANPLPGGMCKTTNDCGYAQTGLPPYVTLTPMTCKSRTCSTTALCRDDADVCTSDNQCCGGNCMGNGFCGPNHPPFIDLGPDHDVPYRQLVTLTPVSVGDPDGDTLGYGWSLVTKPANSLAALSSATAAVPTFTPDVVGDYVITVVVNDGVAPRPSRMTATSTITLHAVNTPPIVNAGPDVAHASRNQPVTLHGTISDPDGDALTCQWTVKPPGGTDQLIAAPISCAMAFDAKFTPSGDATVEGDWIATLQVFDGAHTVSDTVTITVANDAPVASAGPDQVWNIGVTSLQNPTVPLPGSFTDLNGDAASSWAWSVVQAPAGSAITTATLTNAGTQNASFIADAVGRYVLQVQVCDRPASCGTATVNVDVLHAIREFPDDRVVNATDYAHGVNKILMAGPDPAAAGKGKVWLYDPANPSAEVSASLDAVPDAIAATADGTYAVAGSSLWLWVVKFSASSATVTKVSNSVGSVGSIALVPSKGVALVFPASSNYFFRFDYATATTSTTLTNCYFTGTIGRVDKEGANLYVLDPSYDITRYIVGNQGGFSLTSYTSAYLTYPSSVSDLWISQDSAHLFTSDGTIRAISTLQAAGSLGGYVAAFDSLPDGQVVAAAGSTLGLYTTGLSQSGQDTLPQWGVSGVGYSVSDDGVFIRTDPADSAKTIRYAVVHATDSGGQLHSGVVTFP